MDQPPAAPTSLRRATLLAVVMFYLVVTAGSIVRATGSGMGCPDWPKCFGRLIPPTTISQIPSEYLDEFMTVGRGNLLHTWVEYVNRLLGAASGIVVLATLALAVLFRRRAPLVPWLLLAGLAAFALVAWLGKEVVDQNLAPRKVSMHLFGGMATLCFTVAAAAKSRIPFPLKVPPSLRAHLWIATALLILQFVLGSQVREGVDVLMDSGKCCSGDTASALGFKLWGHRLGAFAVVFVVGLLYFRLMAVGVQTAHPLLVRALPISLGIGYLAGVILVRFHIPAAAQPVHLVVAAFQLGILVALLVTTRSEQLPADAQLPPGGNAATDPRPPQQSAHA
jgi:cytochrome c oxidase assembly protein subunit 15